LVWGGTTWRQPAACRASLDGRVVAKSVLPMSRWADGDSAIRLRASRRAAHGSWLRMARVPMVALQTDSPIAQVGKDDGVAGVLSRPDRGPT
jgi:hypothetical protein